MLDLDKIRLDLENLLLSLGRIVRKEFENKNKDFSSKKDANDLLTKTDVEVNDKILAYLEKNYPQITIISEEAEEITRDSEYAFVIDPIDGTRNFVRNIPILHIGIGLVHKNRTLLCMTYNPLSEELFYAIKGKGSFRNNKRVKVGNRTLELSDVVVRTIPDKILEKEVVCNIVGDVYQVKNNMCCHDEISGVACDKFDGFISKNSSPWDYCHFLLVEEAGGKVTDWKGDEFDISKDNIVASNGVIHEELLNNL